MKHVVFNNITEYCEMAGVSAPENPLFFIAHRENDPKDAKVRSCGDGKVSYTNKFYTISFHKIVSGEIRYGRTKYDCSTGTMWFMAPNQTVSIKDIVVDSDSWKIAIDEEYLKGHPIHKLIKRCNFFNYHVNEALHLSPREEQIIKSIFQNMEVEYLNNQDIYSKNLILTHLEALLTYATRFYTRQFINRKELNQTLMHQFTEVLNRYFAGDQQLRDGVPTVEWMANQLAVSQRYLSDTLKAETGKTAIEQINLFVLEEAKSMLSQPDASVTATAYALGFEYPQYFSRMFKKKVGMTPKEFMVSTASA